MIANASAEELIQPSDRPRLWALAQDAVKDGTCRIGEVSLSSGTSFMARYRPVLHGEALSGILVQFTKPRGPSGDCSPAITGAWRFPVQGWRELTNMERTVAEAVASGLTNREAARPRFHVSAYRRFPPTSHLSETRDQLPRAVGPSSWTTSRRPTSLRRNRQVAGAIVTVLRFGKTVGLRPRVLDLANDQMLPPGRSQAQVRPRAEISFRGSRSTPAPILEESAGADDRGGIAIWSDLDQIASLDGRHPGSRRLLPSNDDQDVSHCISDQNY